MTDIDPKERPATPLTDTQDDQTLPIDPEHRETEDEVEEASDDSFPASDPPSFTRSTTAD
jgi:hypothetical protein